MARLYADENFPFPVVVELRRAGHDVLTAMEAGKANQRIPDDEVLAFAAKERRAVLTRNRRHFIRLHKQNVPHAGIVACTTDTDYAAQAARIVSQVARLTSLEHQLIRVNRGD